MKLIVPAYFYPDPAGSDWDTLLASPDGIGAIIVKDRGGALAGQTADPNYTTAIANARAAGVALLYYVETAVATRSVASVEADMDAWVALYGAPSGWFFGQAATAAVYVNYYTTLYAYARGRWVWLGWGATPDDYFFHPENYGPNPAFDAGVVLDTTMAGLASWTPTSWMNNDVFYNRLAVVVHDAATGTTALSDTFGYTHGSTITDATSYNGESVSAFPDDGTWTANPSTKWRMDTGSLTQSGTFGWSGTVPSGSGNQYFFRLQGLHDAIDDAEVRFDYKSTALETSNTADSDGAAVWLRYVSQYWLYEVYIDRRDGKLQAKRKVPAHTAGGDITTAPSNAVANHGAYYNLLTDADDPSGAGNTFPTGPAMAHDATSGAGTVYNFRVTIRTIAAGIVQIQLFRNGTLIYSATDNNSNCVRDANTGVGESGDQSLADDVTAGYYSSVTSWSSAMGLPIAGQSTARTGIRSDNMQVYLDNWTTSPTSALDAAWTTITGEAGIGWAYVGSSSTYAALPSYWSAELDKVNTGIVTGVSAGEWLWDVSPGPGVFILSGGGRLYLTEDFTGTFALSGGGTPGITGFKVNPGGEGSGSLALSLTDVVLPMSPGSVAASVGNAALNATVTFTVAGSTAGATTAVSDELGTVHGISVPVIVATAGTYTLTATDGSTSASLTFTVTAIQDTGSFVVPTPDPPANVQPGSGVIKWVFQDPGGSDVHHFAYNPDAMTSPFGPKNITWTATTAIDGQNLMFEGMQAPVQWQFSGYLRSQAEYDVFVYWAAKRNRIWLTDHYRRAWLIYLTNFQPVPRRSMGVPWSHNYTMNALIVGGPVTPV